MSKKRKHKLRKQERKEQRNQWHINQDVANVQSPAHINQDVTINAEMPDYAEKLKENFLFSFVHYKPNLCGLAKLDSVSAKQLIRKLKVINDTKINQLASSRIIRDNIVNADDYGKLYDGLSPDVEIKEVEFSYSGRIFAYFVDRYVCVVAIDPEHIDNH
jgi:hypothetical protein